MDDINAIASLSAAQAQAKIGNAVALKVLKMANEQQQEVLALLDAAVQSIEQTQSTSSSAAAIDVSA